MHVRRYSIRELARNFGLNVETVRREIRRGHLKAELGGYGRYQVVYDPDLNAWMESGHAKKLLARSLSWNRRACRQPPSTSPGPGTPDPTTAIQPKPRPRKNKP